MSFPNNGIWMPNGSGSPGNGEMGDVSTRNDQKRGYQWFMDTSEQELFFSKKQAIESVNNGATSGAAIMNYSLWRDTSSPQSGGHIGDRLFTPKPVRSSNLSDNNVFSIVSADLNMEKKSFEDQIGIDSSTRLSMSQNVGDPLCLNSGVRKVKVNEVRVLDNCLPEFVGNSYPGEKNKEICTTFLRTSNNGVLGSTYNAAEVNTISVDPAFSDVDKNGQVSSKRDGNLILNNQYFSGINNNMLSIGQAFNRGNYNTVSIGEQYEKNHGNFMSIGPTYKGHDNFFLVDPFYNKSNEMFNMSAGSAYNKGDTDITSLNSVHGQQDANVVSLRTVYSRENSMMLSLGENCDKGEQTTISFGSFQDNHEDSDTSNRLICSRDILLNQSSAQSSGLLGQKDSAEQLNANVFSVVTSRTDGALKNTEQKTKKGSSNNFPANVKSLLSTGILDGIPVKYVSWSREKNLRGVVKGTGYLCSCQDCKLSKAINAYEFERHAGCKTKHPNNHIYFENGKTIYAVVQELKSTPQEMLFEVIQNVTGSPVNQKNFHTWKASYKAATRELQRIYGKDEMMVPS